MGVTHWYIIRMKEVDSINKNKRYYTPNKELIESYASMELKLETDV